MKQIVTLVLSLFLSTLVYSQSVPSYVPTNGLVGWWGFNGNAQDGSVNGNHGTVNGATLTTDKFGNQNGAYSFDGIDDYCNLNSQLPNSFSISLWAEIDSFKVYNGISSELLSTFNQNFGSSGFVFRTDAIPNKIVSGFWNTNGNQIVSKDNIQQFQWNHYLVSYGSGILKLYFNGTLCDSIAGTYVQNNQNIFLAARQVYQGNNPAFFADCTLDDIGIWNRALTQQEITNLYNSQVSGVSIPNLTSCLGDTTSVTISHPTLTGVANATLRMTYNPDSLTYLGFTNLNPNFSGMTITGGNGTLLMDWNAQSSLNIPSGNTVTLRFRVNGNSTLTWDTTFVPSEFSDINFNIIPQTFVNGSLTQNTQRLTWNRTICEGQSFSLGSQTFTTAGNYQGVLPRSSGQCDTLVNLSLNVVPRETTLSATICSNQPYSFNGQSLTSSGVYRDTLTNTLGCDSILVLNLTAHPNYNQPQTVRVCSGTFNFGGSTLTTTGIYSHTYTTAQGCDSTVQLDFAVLDSIRITSSSGVNGFCPTFGIRLGMNAPITNAQYQWYRNGNLLSGEVSDTLLASQVGDYRLDVVISPTCTLSSNSLSVSELNCNRVRGDLRYDNNPQTPLAGVPVHLKTLLGNILMSDTTDSLGMYEMVGYPNGNYLLDAGVNYQWGGVNSTDALWVSRYFTSLLTLTPLRALAGDVNGNGTTNSVDALNITRRSANIIITFPVGDFVNSRPSVVAGGNPVDMNLRVLSTGDVNGSYGVPVSTPVLVLDTVYSTCPTGTATVRFTTSGSGIFERGVCWGTSPSPTISQNKSIAGVGGFGFTHSFGGLTGGTQYYIRAYARNSSGTVYSNERGFVVFSCGSTTITDVDGNTYNTLQIGTQCWMRSNLNVSKFRNGNNIVNITNNTQWSITSNGAWCYYDNDMSNGTLYGKLYNWYAVNDSRGLCPIGWHIPTDVEWTTLENNLGGWSVAGGAMKSTIGWGSSNTGATNSSGFTALPGGGRYVNGVFASIGDFGNWWSSTFLGSVSATYRYLFRGYAFVSSNNEGHRFGSSIRCVRDSSVAGVGNFCVPSVSTQAISGISSTGALTGGDVSGDGGSIVTSRGVAYGLSTNPTILGNITSDSSGLGLYVSTLSGLTSGTQYYVRAYASNAVGTAYGNELIFTTLALLGQPCPGTPTVTDIDGNIYNTVQIGSQCWTQNNLKTSKYRNGNSIINITDNTQWSQTNTNNIGAWCYYDNNANNGVTFGRLYNWYAVNDSRGICPTGWHVPSFLEWSTIENFLGGDGVAGGALKSATGWNLPNIGATNSSNFTALPGGHRDPNGGFGGLGYDGYLWTSSIGGWGGGNSSWTRTLNNSNQGFHYGGYGWGFGFSVRCVRD
jgi:uncharacterized protein (TIGR02145 family)